MENHQIIRKKAREAEKKEKNQKTINKMITVSPYLSIITLNVNGLNSPTKRHRVAEWIFFKKRETQL